jgi:hypothetical protein
LVSKFISPRFFQEKLAARKLPFVKGIARKRSENYAIRFRRERNPQHSSVFGTTKILRGSAPLRGKKANRADYL